MWWPKEWLSLLCGFADRLGTAVLLTTLPFYLMELRVARLELWAGAILSAQFAAAALGNVFWGRVADRLGERRALLFALCGDGIFFFLTAFATTPWLVLTARFLAGACEPAVPCLSLVVRALPPEALHKGLERFTLFVVGAYAVGGVVVGASYADIGWAGTSVVTGVVALLAALATACRADADSGDEVSALPGLGRFATALRSADFITHAATAFTAGFATNLVVSVLPVALLQEFGYGPRGAALAFLTVPVVLAAAGLRIAPTAMRRCGARPVIGIGLVLSIAFCALLASPVGRAHPAALVLLCVCVVVGMQLQQSPNQARAKAIGDALTVRGTGAVVSASRMAWACGQAAGPMAALAAYAHAGPAAPWLVLLALEAALAAVYAALRVPLFTRADSLGMGLASIEISGVGPRGPAEPAPSGAGPQAHAPATTPASASGPTPAPRKGILRLPPGWAGGERADASPADTASSSEQSEDTEAQAAASSPLPPKETAPAVDGEG